MTTGNDRIFHGVDGDILREIYSPEQIQERVRTIANDLNARFYGDRVVAVCVLRGAFVFFSDLVRLLQMPDLELDFVGLSSYGSKQSSKGTVDVTRWLSLDVTGAHVLVVEDIVDTGRSMRTLLDKLGTLSLKSCTLCTLVDKSERRECAVPIDYSCFQMASGFLVGYGLDFAQKYRHLPGIYEVERPTGK